MIICFIGRSDPAVFDPMSVSPRPASPCHDFPGPGLARAHLERHSHHNPMAEYMSADESHVHALFNGFVKKHNKNYTAPEDHAMKKNVFKHNIRFKAPLILVFPLSGYKWNGNVPVSMGRSRHAFGAPYHPFLK